MKAIVIYKAGDAQQLQLEERPIPTLKEGWTLVKVKGFGINRSEIFTRQGHSPSVIFPRILGIECVGVVEATTCPTLQKGQTVVSLMGEMGRAFDGSYAEKITQLFAYIDEHDVPVAPEKVFALEEIVAAHQYVESSAGYGKVVVRIN